MLTTLVVGQECSVLDYMAQAIQCELTVRYVLYISVTLCLCLQVVKSARPSTPQGLSYSILIEPTGMKGVSI